MNSKRTNTDRTNTDLAQAQRRRDDDHPDRGRVNYGKAEKFEIWEVARAATAANFVFEPLKIRLPGSGGHMHFADGGLGSANNPTQEATNELEELYGANAIGIVVSVGTARKAGDRKPGFFTILPATAKKYAADLTDPEPVHRITDKNLERKGCPYFRINDPGRLGIEMDEWKPRRSFANSISGSKTLSTIEDAFNTWIADSDNQKYLRACATQLVKCRQARMHTAQWERFATGTRFVCRARNCEQADFLDRKLFTDHLAEKHRDRVNTNGEEEEACKRQWRYRAAPNA